MSQYIRFPGLGVNYPLLATDGTILAPSYAFASEPSLGFYRAASGVIGVSKSLSIFSTLSVGGSASGVSGITITGTPTTGATQVGIYNTQVISSTATGDSYGILTNISTANVSFTSSWISQITAGGFTKGAAHTISRLSNFEATPSTAGTNNAMYTDNHVYTGNYFLNSTSTNESLISGDLRINTAGKGLLIKEGSNAKMGIATLVAGTATVSTTAVTANSRIMLTAQSLGTVIIPQALAVTARTGGTSFVITSTTATDTSVVAWIIFEPA